MTGKAKRSILFINLRFINYCVVHPVMASVRCVLLIFACFCLTQC